MSSRKCCGPPPAPWPPENSDHAGPPELPSAGALKSATSTMRASSISRSVAGFALSAASAASLC
eukprot:2896258-Alexandrium_andersonii.AAC.1